MDQHCLGLQNHFVAIKVHSQVTSAFAFIFDLCRPFLANGNVKCEQNHMLPWNPFLIFDANARISCEQGLNVTNDLSLLKWFSYIFVRKPFTAGESQKGTI